MILDSHCHAWLRWPYQPPVPDPDSRARIEQLLYEMDRHEVERAVIIAAAIDDNPRNTDDAIEMAARHPGRFIVFPDLDCRWSATYRRPGGAARLEKALSRWDFCGFTHYLAPEDDGAWLHSTDSLDMFSLAAKRRLIVSLSATPRQMEALGMLAASLPSLVILLHHCGMPGWRGEPLAAAMARVTALADHPNLHVKISGFGNFAPVENEFPYVDMAPVVEALTKAFGPQRLLWGSDYPVSRRHMTYRQCLSMLTRHAPLTEAGKRAALGANMARLLEWAGTADSRDAP